MSKDHYPVQNTKQLKKLFATYDLWSMRILSLIKILFDSWASEVQSWEVVGDEVHAKVRVLTIFCGTDHRIEDFTFPIEMLFMSEKELEEIKRD